MAKKKKEDVEDDGIPAYKKQILKNYGDCWMSAKDIEEDKLNFIPISPALDLAIGGVRESSVTLIAGKAKAGKSCMALQVMKSAYDLYKKPLFYIDIESRFLGLHLDSVQGLPLDKVTVIKSTKSKTLSAEEFLEITRDIIKSVEGAVICLDSVSTLVSADELSGKITSNFRNPNSKLLASFFRSSMSAIALNKISLLCLQHMIANTNPGSPYAPKTYADSGNKIVHAGGTSLTAKSVQKWINPDGKVIGQITDWEVLFSGKGHAYSRISTFLKYGVGLCKEADLLKMGTELGIIEKAGSWLTFDENKVQGEFNMIELLEQNPELCTKLYEEVKNVYN